MVTAVLVGCGTMSRAWLEAARAVDGLSIVGLVDIDGERAQARATEFRLADARVSTSLDEILASTRPDIVFDVVVPAARSGVALAALGNGCHLLTEKPLAANMAEARAIIDAAQRAGRIHAVVQNRRYIAPVRRIQRFIAGGALGRLTSVHCDFFLAPHFGGFRDKMDHVLLLDMAIHTFDAARAMTGRDATRVYCREWEPAGSWYHQGAAAAAIFDMAGGAVFTYRGSWAAEGLRTSWEANWRFIGEHGSLTWDGYDNLIAEVAKGDGGDGLFLPTEPVVVPPLDPSDRIGGHLGVLQDFVAAIDGGAPLETAGSDNLKSLAMVFGAIASAESGNPVEIES